MAIADPPIPDPGIFAELALGEAAGFRPGTDFMHAGERYTRRYARTNAVREATGGELRATEEIPTGASAWAGRSRTTAVLLVYDASDRCLGAIVGGVWEGTP